MGIKSNVNENIMMKTCKRCHLEKDISEFGVFSRKLKSGIRKQYVWCYCKNCDKARVQKWRDKNPEKVIAQHKTPQAKESQKRSKAKNKEKRQAWEKQYYLDNKEKFQKQAKTPKAKETKRLWKKKRRQKDPIFRMRENISNAIGKALRKGKSNKAGQSILQYLAYSIGDLKQHLEKQFDENMSWENYGTYWHIDHKTPQSDLPYSSMTDDNFKICWSLDNLRPLEAHQNISDGATRIRHKKKDKPCQ